MRISDWSSDVCSSDLQGHWISARRGEVLIRENQAAPSLFYLAEGRALIQRDGADVGTLADGALIGEATVLDGAHATGTVTLTANARLWFVPAADRKSTRLNSSH